MAQSIEMGAGVTAHSDHFASEAEAAASLDVSMTPKERKRIGRLIGPFRHVHLEELP
jgi:hypothetical protein